MNIVVVPGPIQIQGISGFVKEDYFILDVTTEEKYAEVFVAADRPSDAEDACLVYLSWGDDTLGKPENKKLGFTKILLFSGSTEYQLEVTRARARYSFRIIGVRVPPDSERVYEIPYTIEKEE